MDERHSRGTFMDSEDWYIQQDKGVSAPTSKQRKKRFLGSHQNGETSTSHSSKSYATLNSSGGETTRGNKENRSDALNRLLARRKRNKLSSLYYSSDDDEEDEFPIASRRLSSSLLQDSSGSELEDSPGTEKSNESDVFGADDEFCMLSIEPKSQDQIKFNGRASGLLPGGGKEMFTFGDLKPTEKHYGQREEFSQGFKNDRNHTSPKNGFFDGFADRCNSDLNDSDLPNLGPGQNSQVTEVVKRKNSPDHTDGNSFRKSPSHALPGNFYKKKFSHMFTNGDKKKAASGRLSLLLSSSSNSDSESDSFLVNDVAKKGLEKMGNDQESPVFGSSNSIERSPQESKKRKYSAESFFFSKKRRSDEPDLDKFPRQISPILKKSSPFQFNDSPRFPPQKHNGQLLRRLSFEDQKTMKAATNRLSSSDSDSDAFWKLSLPSKKKTKAKPTEMSLKSKPSTISASGSRLSPPGISKSRNVDLKDCDPVQLSVSPKSCYRAPTSLVANQSLEEGMQFTDESLRKQLQDIFGNDSDEELEWQPTLKKTKTSNDDVGKKTKKTKGSRYFVKKESGNTAGDYADVRIPSKVQEKKQPESQEMFSDSDDDWERKLQELVDDISSSSRRARSGLALLTHGGKKGKGTSATAGQRSTSVQSSFTRSSSSDHHGSSTYTKPRNSSVSTFPSPSSSSRRYYDNQGLVRSEPEELPKSVTLSSPPKLIQSVSSPKPKRRCRRAISNGSIIYIDDTESESSDDDVVQISSNVHAMPLKGRMGRREIGQVISPRIRELQEEDARSEYNTRLDPVLSRELEEELAPAKQKKAPKSRRGHGSLNDPVEMVVEVTLNEAIQREIQAGLRLRTSSPRGSSNTSTSASRGPASAIGQTAAAMRATSGTATSLNRPVSHATSSPGSPGLFTFSAGPSHQSRIPVTSPNSFYPASPPTVKSPRGRGKKAAKVTKRNTATTLPSTAAGPGFSPDVIPFVPTSPSLQSSPRSKNTRSRQKTGRGSLNRPLDPDPLMVVQQIDNDEAMARRMQEQMDMEFAQALMREEESAVAAAHVAAQQSPSMPFPPPHMPADFLRPPPIQMPVPRAFNPPLTSQFNPCHGPQAAVRKSPTTRGRRRQTRSHIADQVAVNQIPNFDPHVDTAMYLHVAMGMGLMEPGRPPTVSPPTRRGRGRGRLRQGVAAANAVQGDDYEALLALGDIIGEARPKGLNKSSIDQLPTKVFKKTASSGKDDECSVCMGEYEDGENLRILPCFHNFHVKCIDKWIKDNATCPICRVPVKLS